MDDWLSVAGSKMFQCVKATLTLGMYATLKEMDDKTLTEYIEMVYGVPKEMMLLLPGLKTMLKERFGQSKVVQVTREELMFEADVTVQPGSARRRNLDVERRQWIEFLKVIVAAPQLALSRALLARTAKMFDLEDDALLDEMTALAQKMIGVNANQAGRNQGGGAEAPGAGPGGVGDVVRAMIGQGAMMAGNGGVQ